MPEPTDLGGRDVEAAHTPVPWEVQGHGLRTKAIVSGGADEPTVVAVVGDGWAIWPARESDANAAFIVQAVNAHDDLLDIAERLKAYNAHYSVATHEEWFDLIRDTKAAIAKATERS